MTKILGMGLLMGSLMFLASGTAVAQASCATDFNGDGASNEADLEILKSYIGADDSMEGYAPAVDLNDDGVVDIADLNVFLGCN